MRSFFRRGSEEAETAPGFLSRLAQGLSKTRSSLVEKVSQVLAGRTTIDDELYEELEEVLIQADVGVATSEALVEAVRKRVRRERVTNPEQVERLLQDEMLKILTAAAGPLAQPEAGRLTVYLVVGVNGTGKTTTIGKLAHRYHSQGHRVLLGAADTFRAAAIDQLEAWGQRVGVDVIRHQEGGDPAAVVFDAVHAAKARRAELLLIDTAGRLQTKVNLMAELAKIQRVIARELPGSADEVLLVIDATTGQNGLSQARLFAEAVPLTGVALTKLDGTARGGIILAIAAEMQLPVKLIGVGERLDDLRDFEPGAFASALFRR